jgi:hypothetical protein
MFTRQACLSVLAVAALAACSSSDDTPAQAPEPIESGAQEADAASETTAEADAAEASWDAPFDGTAIAATGAETKLSFSLNATGEGALKVKSLSIDTNLGSLSLSGAPHTGVAFESHAWTDAGWDIYDVLSIADDGSNLAVTFLYCQGTALTHFYVESFTDKIQVETATGTCEVAQQETAVKVSLPALKALPAALDTGITIDGTDIHLDAAGGTVTLGSQSWQLVPFNTVDCTQCPGGPWFEIHSMLLGDQQGCFTILYLYPDDKTKLQAAYTMCLPSLDRPTAWFDVSWDGVPVQSLMHPPLPRPAPPGH